MHKLFTMFSEVGFAGCCVSKQRNLNCVSKMLQIQAEIDRVTKQLEEQREEYKATERNILSAGKASQESLQHLLSKFKTQKESLQTTRKNIATLSEQGILVRNLKTIIVIQVES